MKNISETRIDAVSVTEVTAIPSEQGQGEALTASAALFDMKGNETIGIMKHNNIWSKKTWDTLANLFASMEEDIAAHLGKEGAAPQESVDATGTGGGLFPGE